MLRLRWLLLILYGVLLGLLIVGPLVLERNDRDSFERWLALSMFTLVSQAIFILAPGRPEYLMPVRARRLFLPALIAGVMMTTLLASFIGAMAEFFRAPTTWESMEHVFWRLLFLTWLGWTVFFWLGCRRLNGFVVVRRMVAWMLGGSLLHLLATVPAHLVVSRRPGCVVGMATAAGLFAGLYVMIWSFGPGVMLLFWAEARKRMAGHCPKCGYNLFGLAKQRCPESGRPFVFSELKSTPEELGFIGDSEA